MKKIFFATAIVLATFSLVPQATNAGNSSRLSFFFAGDPLNFKKNMIDLKEISQGKPVTVLFEYKNNTDKPVLIAEVITSCGCTVASYEKEAIMPGKTGKISGVYNAATLGSFTKTLTVKAVDGFGNVYEETISF